MTFVNCSAWGEFVDWNKKEWTFLRIKYADANNVTALEMMAAWNLQDVGLRQQLGWNELTFPHEELCASWKSLAISAPIRADTSIRPKWETKTTTATSITLQQRRTAEKTHSSQPGNSISVFITVSKQKDTLIWEPSGRGENGLDADKRWWSGRKPQLRNEEEGGGREGRRGAWWGERKRGGNRGTWGWMWVTGWSSLGNHWTAALRE